MAESASNIAEALGIAPVRVGEHFGRTLRYSAAQIAEFARLSLDGNPLHDGTAAGGAVIASGQHSAAIMMGLVASHLSRSDDGIGREALCLNFNFSFKAPIHAEQEITMKWLVALIEFNARLDGWIAQLNGTAYSAGSDCVVARGTVLVRLTQ
jgi:acyl dehydratase